MTVVARGSERLLALAIYDPVSSRRMRSTLGPGTGDRLRCDLRGLPRPHLVRLAASRPTRVLGRTHTNLT
jgi:hypothetical protein